MSCKAGYFFEIRRNLVSYSEVNVKVQNEFGINQPSHNRSSMTEKKLTEVFETYFPKVFGYYYKRLNNRQDVEDLTQISLGIFLIKLKENKVKSDFIAGYLWKICRSQLANFINNKSKNPLPISLNDQDWIPSSNPYEESKTYQNRLDDLIKCASKIISGIDQKTNLKLDLNYTTKEGKTKNIINEIDTKFINLDSYAGSDQSTIDTQKAILLARYAQTIQDNLISNNPDIKCLEGECDTLLSSKILDTPESDTSDALEFNLRQDQLKNLINFLLYFRSESEKLNDPDLQREVEVLENIIDNT